MAGEVVGVSAGGVGSLTVQLLRRTGATVIGPAGRANHEWLRRHGVIPVAYGPGQRERVRSASQGGLDAFIDTFGGGYVDLGGQARPPSRTIPGVGRRRRNPSRTPGRHRSVGVIVDR